MTQVYIKVSCDLIDTCPNFFAKLKSFVGEIFFLPTEANDMGRGTLTIGFYTNKVEIKEGDSRQVYIEARRDGEDLEFIKIFK